MLHTKTPDENGWYWAEEAEDEWFMVYADVEADEPFALVISDDRRLCKVMDRHLIR